MSTICYHHRCISLLTLLWMLIDAIIGYDQRTHTLALFLSLRYLALFPLLSVSHKNPIADYFGINWNTDFNVLTCSHFKGSINTKIITLNIIIISTMILSVIVLSIMIFSIIPIKITIIKIRTVSITTLCITIKFNTQYSVQKTFSILYHFVECRNTECHLCSKFCCYRYAECHYPERCYTECRSAIARPSL